MMHPSLLLLLLLAAPVLAEEDLNGIHLKVVASKSQLIPRQDLDILKQEIEHDINQELNKLEEKWATEERLAQKQVGTWNMHGAPIFLPHQYNSPYLITQLVRNAQSSKNRFKENDQSDEQWQMNQQQQQQQIQQQQQQQMNQQMFQYQMQQDQAPSMPSRFQEQFQGPAQMPPRFQEESGQQGQQKVMSPSSNAEGYFKEMKNQSLQRLMNAFQKVK